ncbi:hypothetical protein NQ314_000168 [Rhamnusium bicolor]|uniref:tRNA-specific adenosine deaminase 1 n=1 Tax=Rhamnusium bicolor TaxID=1586634 RepID=A0AAV8ZVG3_9CUCU|nr:hypothetical protein NQ314_000168 [Rhamnusium bicolor]
MSKWCHLGVQGALLSILLEKPIYFSSFTIAAKTPFCKEALERALYDRLGNVKLNHPYNQNRMIIGQSTSCEFEFSKNSGRHPCASSISWCKIKDKCMEVAVEGKRQGVTKKNINTSSGRLNICKLRLFSYFKEICDLHNLEVIKNCDIKTICYKDAKLLATDYKDNWNILRKSFKIWTNKDAQLLDFF